MRFPQTLVLTSLIAACAAAPAALAQTYSGQEFTVNAPPPGGGILLYPGEKTRDMGPIQLHLPAKRHPATARAASARVAAAEPPSPRQEPVRRAAPPKPAPAPEPKIARAEPPRAAQPAPSAPAPATPGLTKRSVILFAPNATDPAQSALGAIKFLATDLNTAMTGPGSRIQLQAFGGTRGDKGSDARRLSLKRALSIRQVLIDDGVPADRIDVHAGGGVDDDGPADRVDVFVKA